MVEVFPDPPAVMAAAADRFVAAAEEAVRQRGRFMVALSGGFTPAGLYRRLAEEPCRSRVDWTAVQVFWGDERCVPPDAPESNYRMARDALLDRVPIPPAQIHRIRGEADPAEAAREYEAVLREQLETPRGPPRAGSGLDLVVLGLGPDGHTASLFPGSASLTEGERWTLAVQGPVAPRWRVTLTPVLIRVSREVMFLVTGREKAPALRRALEGTAGPAEDPVRVVLPRTGVARWLVDTGAAVAPGGSGPPAA